MTLRCMPDQHDDPIPDRRQDEIRNSPAVDEWHSEQLYRNLIENSLGLICLHDLEGKLLMVNPAAAETLGYTPKEMEGRNLRELVAPLIRHRIDSYLAN